MYLYGESRAEILLAAGNLPRVWRVASRSGVNRLVSKAGVTEHEEGKGGGSETLGDLFLSLHEVTQFWVLDESCFFFFF